MSNDKKNDAVAGEKKITSVVSKAPTVKKKSEVKRFLGVFMSQDVDSVKRSVLHDVIIPATKSVIAEAVTSATDMLLYGEVRHGGGGARRAGGSKVSYDGCFRPQSERSNVDRSYDRARNALDYDDIEFDTRGDAEAVLSAMDEIISTYGVVTVAEFFDLSQITNTAYNSNRYGWTDLRNAYVKRVRGGATIVLPKAYPID